MPLYPGMPKSAPNSLNNSGVVPPSPQQAQPGILRKMFGGPLSQSNAEGWPELAKTWTGMENEMPAQTAGTGTVRPMNMFEKWWNGPAVNGTTYPWGTIALNRDNIEKNKVDLPQLLSHELTHIGQRQRDGIINTWFKGGSKDAPDYENEANDVANNRYKTIRRDIPLNAHTLINGAIASAYSAKR